MQVHLSGASPDVIGGGIFLMLFWLGLPAIGLVIFAVYLSLKVVDNQLRLLSAAVVVLVLALAFSAPMALLSSLGALYVLLVLGFGLHRRYRRANTS
jgi:hypothetical protein